MALTILPDTVLVRNSNQLYSEVDNEIVMLSVDTSEYYGLNEVGSVIWSILEKPKSLYEIIDYLVLKYDVERSVCELEIMPFIDNLLESGVIHSSEI